MAPAGGTSKSQWILSDPPSTASTPVASQNDVRPSLGKQWQTERPKATGRPSLLSVKLTRPATHGTNVSMLNEAIWNTNANAGDDSSSTSESSEEEDTLATKKGNRRSRRRQGVDSRGSYSRFQVGNDEYTTKGKVSKRDGRLNISVNETSNRGYLANALGANFLKHLSPGASDQMEGEKSLYNNAESLSGTSDVTVTSRLPRPKLNIVVMVIGSRGDIQPFLKLGKNLKQHGHQVRIATHPAFKDFVQKDSGLEFFSVGGDPAELMAFMVKNPGMIPTMDTLKKGEVGRRREQMAEMFEGFWRACINATDDEKDVSNLKMMGEKAPFIADAIIANPPCFAHIHCAERLGIPLHLMFTFPYTPTQAFPHPLANIKKTNVDPGYANFMSYPLVEMMTWQGLGDLVNNFRVKTLGLEAVSTLWAPGQLYRLKVPYTYLWSPGLVPKPKDWGPEIDIAGFVFLDLASSFKPPDELKDFLNAGDPPVYIGFGSIVIDDPDKFTALIFEAVKKAGVRALVSKGWGGLGDDNAPDNIYMLDNTPHDWLFPQVKAVVHHGGAGTTAIGLKCGKPTMVVPFFGDQQFWGAMIGEAGAGAMPIPYKDLTVDKLAEGIKQLLTEEAQCEALKIAKSIEEEGDGAENAVTSFHRSLMLRGLHSMRCSILEDRVAVWILKNTHLRLSAVAAELLVERKRISWKQLRLIRHNEWNDFEGPGEPITGVTTAVTGTVTDIAMGVGSVPFKLAKSAKRRTMHEQKKKRKLEQVGPNDNVPGAKSLGSQQEKSSSQTEIDKAFPNAKPDGIIGKGTLSHQHQKSKLGPNGGIADAQAPAKAGDKATTGPDMSKHTIQGEPVMEGNYFDNESIMSEDPREHPAEEIAQDVGVGVGKTVEAIARAPVDLSLALAQGFHNAPRLYGDSTVRRPIRITGIKSGLKAAGHEFAFGIHDGVTGLVAQPYNGARDNGPLGFVKGVGMGLTGFILKDIAAIVGPFGYTLKGVHKEMLKSRQPTNFIRKARIMQGQRDLLGLGDKDREKCEQEVSHGWSVIEQVWKIMDEKRSEGLKGRATAMKERKYWRQNGAFENVEMAQRALDATKRGESLEAVFAQQRADLEKVHRPRKTVEKEMEQGRLQEHGGKTVV